MVWLTLNVPHGSNWGPLHIAGGAAIVLDSTSVGVKLDLFWGYRSAWLPGFTMLQRASFLKP